MLLQLPPEIYALLKGRLTFKDAIESPALTLMSRHQRHRIARFNRAADLVIFVGAISSDTFSLPLVSSQDFTIQETCPHGVTNSNRGSSTPVVGSGNFSLAFPFAGVGIAIGNDEASGPTEN